MGSRQSKNDYENTQTEGLFPAVSVSSKSAFDTDFNYDSSTLTEKQEIVLLRGRVAEQKKELESKNEVVTALQRNFEALSMFLKKERAERDFLKNQYEKIKEENMKFIEKITNLTDKIKILSADNELLAKDRVRAKHLAEENDQLLVQIKGLESQITSLNNVNKRVSELLEKSQSDLDKLRRDYKIESEKVTSVTQKLNELTKVMEDTIKQLKHEHISELDAQKKEYKAVIDELKDTLAKLKVSSTKEQENLISEIQQLRLKNKEIESELDSFKAQFSQKDLQSKSDSNKNSELLDQINSLKEMLKSERYSFNLEKDELQNKLAELTKTKNELKNQNGELSLRLKQLSEDGLNKDSLMNKNFESQERNIQKLNSIVVSLNKEIEEYKSVVEKLKLTNFTQKCDLEAEMKSQASAFLAQLEDKDSIIKIKESKIDELQMELRVMGQKFANSNKENNSSERELQIKDAEILKLKNEISSLTRRIKAMLGEIDSKEHQISEKEKLIENENSEHQNKCQNYESEINHINDELLRQKQMFDEMTKGEDIQINNLLSLKF